MATPYPYVPGTTLNLISSDGKDIEVLVIRPLMLPTVSAVVEVQMKTVVGVKKAVLKMYDRRFGDRRGLVRNGSYRSHNKRSEEAFQDYVRSGKAKTLLEQLNNETLYNETEVDWICESSDHEDEEDGDYDENKDYYEDETGENSDDKDDEDDDEDDEEDSQSEWDELGEFECETFNRNRMSYLLETRTYRKLHHLQGNCVPRLISSIIGDHSLTPDNLPPLYFQPMGVLLEYIPGFTIRDLVTEIPNDPPLWKSIIQKAIALAKQLNHLGVIHADLDDTENMIVSKVGDRTFQVYVIDFKRSLHRSDFTWNSESLGLKRFKQTTRSIGDAVGIGIIMIGKVFRLTGVKLDGFGDEFEDFISQLR